MTTQTERNVYVTVDPENPINVTVNDIGSSSSSHSHSNTAELDLIDQDLSTSGTPEFASLQLTGGDGTQGTLSWNTDEETLDLIQNGAVLQLGQEIHIHCRNNTGSEIADGTVVMATGSIGASGRITIAPMGTSASYAKYILGVTTESIPNGEDGKVTPLGKVRGINTSSWVAGTVLYASTSVSGEFTSSEPSSGMRMPIAFVINQHASVGTIMVRVTPINELLIAHGETAYGWGDHSSAGYRALTNMLFGTETDNTTFEADGSMQMNGSATVWNDIYTSLLGKRLFSTVGTVDYDYADNAIVFSPNGSISDLNDVVNFSIQFPHSIKTNSVLDLHVHWVQTDATDRQFTVKYRIQSNGEVTATAWTTTVVSTNANNVFSYVSGNLNQITDLLDIDVSSASLSSVIEFQFTRTDAVAGDLQVKFVDCHYEMDTLGSRQEYVK